MPREVYFLVLRFSWPSAQGHESTEHAFYQTDHDLVAEELVRLLTADGEICMATPDDLSGPPPIYEVRSAADLDVSQRVRYRRQIQDAKNFARPVTPGPGTSLRLEFLKGRYERAHDLEPMVRDELADDICPPQPVAQISSPFSAGHYSEIADAAEALAITLRTVIRIDGDTSLAQWNDGTAEVAVGVRMGTLSKTLSPFDARSLPKSQFSFKSNPDILIPISILQKTPAQILVQSREIELEKRTGYDPGLADAIEKAADMLRKNIGGPPRIEGLTAAATGAPDWQFENLPEGEVLARNRAICQEYASLDMHDLLLLCHKWRGTARGFVEATKRSGHYHGHVVHDAQVDKVTKILETAIAAREIEGVNRLGRCLRRPDDSHLHYALATLDELDARLRAEGALAGSSVAHDKNASSWEMSEMMYFSQAQEMVQGLVDNADLPGLLRLVRDDLVHWNDLLKHHLFAWFDDQKDGSAMGTVFKDGALLGPVGLVRPIVGVGEAYRFLELALGPDRAQALRKGFDQFHSISRQFVRFVVGYQGPREGAEYNDYQLATDDQRKRMRECVGALVQHVDLVRSWVERNPQSPQTGDTKAIKQQATPDGLALNEDGIYPYIRGRTEQADMNLIEAYAQATSSDLLANCNQMIHCIAGFTTMFGLSPDSAARMAREIDDDWLANFTRNREMVCLAAASRSIDLGPFTELATSAYSFWTGALPRKEMEDAINRLYDPGFAALFNLKCALMIEIPKVKVSATLANPPEPQTQPKEPALTEDQVAILLYLKGKNMALKQAAIVKAMHRTEKTIRKDLKVLRGHGYINRPAGTRSGDAITDKGLARLAITSTGASSA